MNIRLDGYVALITGSTGGIGGAIASEFYKSGATIVITGRSAERLDELENQLRQKSKQNPRANQINGIRIDLGTPGAENILVSQTIEKFNKLDILVNNAAMGVKKLIIRSDIDFVNHVNTINYVVPYMLTRAALPHMKRAHYGRIINMTSISGQYGDTGLSAYSASKSALTAFTKTVADEYGRYNITANCVAPGVINTNTAVSTIRPEMQQDLIKRIPVHRFGTPNEVADLVTFLASSRAAYINGQEIAINGGLYR